jgi:hypothetical protein
MRYIVILLVLVLSFASSAQDKETLGKKIDEITFSWDLEQDELDEYDGMLKFCSDKDYRLEVIGLLNEIHHYDSVLIERLQRAVRFSKNKEIEKTLSDIEQFEAEYSMKEFIKFLFDECQGIYELEKNKEDLQDEIGEESYGGRRYILETELARYIHHITKKVDLIRDHVHHLHIE